MRRPHNWRRWLETALLLTGSLLVLRYAPFARVFGFKSFEARHGGYQFDFYIYMAAWVIGKSIYLYFFRRKQLATERAVYRDALRRGRVKRMSFAARWLFILGTLGLVIFGWIASGPDRTHLLAVAVPLFLLFCAVELNFIVHPGETVFPDPRDEFLAFFKARMLQAGYIASIAALVVLYLTSLFAPGYLGLLLPVVLTACLLVPSLVYNRLDHHAGSNG